MKLGERISYAMHKATYRATGGALGGNVFGRPVLLLTTSGRRSGKRRTTPIVYLKDGDQYVIVASNAGAPRNSAWWYNLQANPAVSIQVRRQKIEAVTRPATPAEEAALWPRLDAMYAGFARYREKTSRTIPMVIITPVP